MREREPGREAVGRGVLYYLGHPGTNIFSGYGVTMDPDRADRLVGLLMVDRPHPVNPTWLQLLLDTYGECQLYPMTASGERGLACQMHIEPDSVPYLQQIMGDKSRRLQAAMGPLLAKPPAPTLSLRWDGEKQLWTSRLAASNELLPEVRQVFENAGYGALAVETNIGIVHVCHASDTDIRGFQDKPASYRWELIEMPTAPLVRLGVHIFDQPLTPFFFESFLNVGAADQLRMLTQLAGQDRLYLAFYGDDLEYRFTKTLPHDELQWQRLDEIIEQALVYWEQVPEAERDFDKAKAVFMLLS